LRGYRDDWQGLLEGDVAARRKLFDLLLRDQVPARRGGETAPTTN